MLSRVAAAIVLVLGTVVTAAASAVNDSATVTVNVEGQAGPADPDLAGATWNAGDLSLISPLKPALVRTDAKLDEVSRQKGALDLEPLFERVDTILREGSRPLILLNRMPSWLARSVPPDCTQDRRGQTPCPPTAMGPKDMAAWEQFIEEVVRGLAEHYDRDLTFELWNEPNNKKSWADSQSVFIDTVMAMHRAIARVEDETGVDLSAGGVALGEVGPLLARYREAAVEQGTPPDFISWHNYTRNPLDYRRDVSEVRDLIADARVPLAITEWNHYGLKGDERNTAAGAAFNLASLIEMERAGVGQATFYRSVSFGPNPSDAGLVTGEGKPRPSWWTMQLWRSLGGDRLLVSGDDPQGGLWARATRAEDQVDLLLSSYADQRSVAHNVRLELAGSCDASSATVRTIDGKSPDFRPRRRVDLDPLTVQVASPGTVWVSIDCSGGDTATQIEPHPNAAALVDQPDAEEGESSWLVWGVPALAAALLFVLMLRIGARRRARRTGNRPPVGE